MIDPESPEPFYLQLAELLAKRIASGELSGRMPPEREMALEYGVSYGTVRHTMIVLRERKLIRTVHGKGTFATGQKSD